MKILVVGDPHGDMKKLRAIPIREEKPDYVIITGDLGKADLARKRFFENVERKKNGLPELKDDAKYIEEVYREIHDSTLTVLRYLSKFAPVYFIQGNVGLFTKSEARKYSKKSNAKLPSTLEEITEMDEVHFVKNVVRRLDGIKIGFLEYFVDTNWVRDFKPSDFKKRMERAKKQTKKAKSVLNRFGDVDILVHHQPPYGVLDEVGKGAPKHWQGKHAGSQVILNYIKRRQPSFALCGHIHEGEGTARIGKTKVYNLGVGGYTVLEF